MERPLAVLASGGGTTAEPLFDFTRVVVSSLGKAGVIDKVKRYNEKEGKEAIAVEVVRKRDYPTLKEWDTAVTQAVVKYQPGFVSLNGWSLLLPDSLLSVFPNRVVNSHPGPLDFEHRLKLPEYLGEVNESHGKDPLDFGGWGMHGLAVHEAVKIFYGWTGKSFPSTEVTLHLLDPERYDNGPTVARVWIPYSHSDSAEQIQEKVKVAERIQNVGFWQRAVEEGRLPDIIPRREPLIKENQIGQLWQARAKAKFAYPGG